MEVPLHQDRTVRPADLHIVEDPQPAPYPEAAAAPTREADHHPPVPHHPVPLLVPLQEAAEEDSLKRNIN